MSEYVDVLFDLPERAMALLCELGPSAQKLQLDVTLLLMAASMTLVIPRERLNPSHPAGDSKRFPLLSLNLERILGSPFVESPFSPSAGAQWHYGRVSDFGDGPDSWEGATPLSAGQPTAFVLAIIRNALAHGNLASQGDPIQNLVFVSEEIERAGGSRVVVGYKYLLVPVEGFREFLLAWLGYVKHGQFPYRELLAAVAAPLLTTPSN